jgi:hypothetical protein
MRFIKDLSFAGGPGFWPGKRERHKDSIERCLTDSVEVAVESHLFAWFAALIAGRRLKMKD